MYYVKHFNINGVDTKQVACIELTGVPNAATEGAVGVLGMDMSSPTHEVYRCVAVNGSVYTWELLSAGMSVLGATITREGAMTTSFAYNELKIPTNYLIKAGDLVIDVEGYMYQVTSIGGESCDASYTGTHLGGAGRGTDCRLVVTDGKLQLVTENGNVLSELDYLASDESTIHRDPSTGVASVIGIRTVDGGLLHIFVGTQAQFETLTREQQENLFAIITDDKAKETVFDAIDTLQKVMSGESEVPLARDANSAAYAGSATYAEHLYKEGSRNQNIGNGGSLQIYSSGLHVFVVALKSGSSTYTPYVTVPVYIKLDSSVVCHGSGETIWGEETAKAILGVNPSTKKVEIKASTSSGSAVTATIVDYIQVTTETQP